MNAAQKACSVTKRTKLKLERLESCTTLIVSTSVKSRNLTEIYKMEGSLLFIPVTFSLSDGVSSGHGVTVGMAKTLMTS